MNIYLVRHPETVKNVENKLTGWEFSPYSDAGKIQFEKIKNYFEGKVLSVYSSDLPRALKLGKILSKENKTKIHISKLLREQNFEKTRPKTHHETEKDFRERVLSFVKKFDLKEGVIITHAGTIKEIINYWIPGNKIDFTCPRDVIFKIETVKNENKLSIIQT